MFNIVTTSNKSPFSPEKNGNMVHPYSGGSDLPATACQEKANIDRIHVEDTGYA
jgi:hypothetical protein